MGVRVLAAMLQVHWRGGVGETRRQLAPALESIRPPRLGPGTPGRLHYEASGPTLNKKTAAICLHCYLCFKRMTGCQ